jgi:hypothetical protein
MGRGTVFWHRLEIARRHAHRQQASFPHNASLGLPFPLLPCLPNWTTSHLAYLYSFHNAPSFLFNGTSLFFRCIIDSDYAYMVFLRVLDPPEREKIICKISSVDLEAGDWLIVYTLRHRKIKTEEVDTHDV